jgi:hypothetical protein
MLISRETGESGGTSETGRMLKKAVQQGRSERRGEEVHTELRLTRSLRSYASG